MSFFKSEREKEKGYQGLLIAFDGLDSSGKATQAAQLANRLRDIGWTVHLFQTPDYSTRSGKELKLRLQNKLGDWELTSWEEKMRFFANNRAEHKEEVIAALCRNEIVIYDRYVPSSLAFVTVEATTPKDVDARREDVQEEVKKYEYESNCMPKEDISIFLDVPPAIALKLLEERKEDRQDDDEYTDHLHVQERLYNEYAILSQADPKQYARIYCTEGESLLPIREVSDLVWGAVVAAYPEIKKPGN